MAVALAAFGRLHVGNAPAGDAQGRWLAMERALQQPQAFSAGATVLRLPLAPIESFNQVDLMLRGAGQLAA